jgi:hypothetical protein
VPANSSYFPGKNAYFFTAPYQQGGGVCHGNYLANALAQRITANSAESINGKISSTDVITIKTSPNGRYPTVDREADSKNDFVKHLGPPVNIVTTISHGFGYSGDSHGTAFTITFSLLTLKSTPTLGLKALNLTPTWQYPIYHFTLTNGPVSFNNDAIQPFYDEIEGGVNDPKGSTTDECNGKPTVWRTIGYLSLPGSISTAKDQSEFGVTSFTPGKEDFYYHNIPVKYGAGNPQPEATYSCFRVKRVFPLNNNVSVSSNIIKLADVIAFKPPVSDYSNSGFSTGLDFPAGNSNATIENNGLDQAAMNLDIEYNSQKLPTKYNSAYQDVYFVNSDGELVTNYYRDLQSDRVQAITQTAGAYNNGAGANLTHPVYFSSTGVINNIRACLPAIRSASDTGDPDLGQCLTSQASSYIQGNNGSAALVRSSSTSASFALMGTTDPTTFYSIPASYGAPFFTPYYLANKGVEVWLENGLTEYSLISGFTTIPLKVDNGGIYLDLKNSGPLPVGKILVDGVSEYGDRTERYFFPN